MAQVSFDKKIALGEHQTKIIMRCLNGEFGSFDKNGKVDIRLLLEKGELFLLKYHNEK